MLRLPNLLPLCPARLAVAIAVVVMVGACTGDRVEPASPTAAAPAPKPVPRVEALLINGGHSKTQNYYSHLLHLRRLTQLLVESSIERDRITILSGDGENPEPDLATLRPDEFPDAWLLERTKLGKLLSAQTRYENSSVEGMYLLPAKKAAIETWFQTRGRLLGQGDTLLLYVTDHGMGDKKQEGGESRVVLWGEKLSSSELSKLLERLEPGVRVVMLMSQCFSGGFARALYDSKEQVRPNTCGFYSTLSHRLAWGCYPDAREDFEGLGHSMRFLDALAPGKSFAAAHEGVVLTDATPDVPHRSSEAYLRDLVRKPGGVDDELVDELLAQAWKSPELWEHQIALLKRLSLQYGLPTPKSLAEWAELDEQLSPGVAQGKLYQRKWTEALSELANSAQQRFVLEDQAWAATTFGGLRAKHAESTAQKLDPDDGGATREKVRKNLAKKASEQFGAFAVKTDGLYERLRALKQRKDDASDLTFRLEVREGVLLRMRVLLEAIAGEVLASREPERTTALTELRKCEAWSLPGPSGAAEAVEAPAAYTSLSNDLARIVTLQPAWLGISFGTETLPTRKKHGLSMGAALVREVYPGSPAHSAGLLPGDTIVGALGQPFLEPHGVKEWTMISRPHDNRTLDVLRDGKRITVDVTLMPLPDKMPRLPNSLSVGEKAPARGELVHHRGPELSQRGDRLLFFFATWCGLCKQSVPALLALEKKRGIPVLAVSTESQQTIDEFLAKWKKPFPHRLALDPRGVVAGSYRARAFPTYVLVGSDGRVKGAQRGFSPKQGFAALGFPD
jgi:thiol-disulfide isomerase/thioredoxin